MNRLMVRLSTPYVAMGLPMGTSPAALVPPVMLQQQQQAMMNQMGGQPGMAGQSGAAGYGGSYVDPYNPTGAMPGAGYPPGGYGQQAYGYGGTEAGMEPRRVRGTATKARPDSITIRTIPTPPCLA